VTDNVAQFVRRDVGDTLSGYLSGLADYNQRDRMSAAMYVAPDLTPDQLETAYRGNWIARKVVDIPASDATRMWRNWEAESDQIEKLEETERKFHVKQKVKQALIWARLYGGAGMIIGTDDGAMDQPINLDRIGAGSLKWLHVLPRQRLGATGQLILDVESEWYGQPQYYQFTSTDVSQVTQNLKVHPSRVVRFVGQSVPDPIMTSGGWGESVLVSVDTAVRQATMAPQAIGQLITEANLDIIKYPNMTQMLLDGDKTEKLKQISAWIHTQKSVWHALTLDSNMDWERMELNFRGIPDVLQLFLLLVCGAADIPATRFLGQSPAGLSATGESDTRNFYDKIKSDQEDTLTPAMSNLDEVLIRSSLGSRPPEVWYNWAALWQLSGLELANITKLQSEAATAFGASGLIQTAALAKGVQNQLVESGVYPGLEQAIADAEAEGDVVQEPDPVEEAQLKAQATLAHAKTLGVEPQRMLPAPGPPAKLPVGDAMGRRARRHRNAMTRQLTSVMQHAVRGMLAAMPQGLDREHQKSMLRGSCPDDWNYAEWCRAVDATFVTDEETDDDQQAAAAGPGGQPPGGGASDAGGDG
jgi:phage-related protein (TIGR01555 family)